IWREWGPRAGTRPVGSGGWQSVAPSAVAFEGYAEPVALDEQGIEKVIADFAAAARRSVAAGFDVIEVHAAHGYLLHQFLSPLSNTRTDAWGGTLEQRAALLVRVVEAVRREIGDARALFVRLSATDWAPEGEQGWDLAQTSAVASMLAPLGVDLFDISSGGILAHPVIPATPGYQVHFAEEVRRASATPVSAVGLITTAQQACDIIDEGRADAVMMGRK